MLKIILITLIALLAAVLALAATRPGSFRVERSIRINAPPEKILPLINDFHQWGVWSPYEKLEPGMSRAYSGTPAGKGAVYEWQGNGKAGAGRMEIVAALPTQTLIKLDFSKPFTAHNIAGFTARPDGAATRLTWSMEGPAPFMTRLVGLFFNMDQMIGGDFETGLTKLKAVVEQ
jgi:hypothetical protein